MFLSLDLDAFDFSSAVLSSDVDRAAFRVQQRDNSFDEIPLMLMIFDGEGIVFKFDRDALERQFVPFFEVSPAADALVFLHWIIRYNKRIY